MNEIKVGIGNYQAGQRTLLISYGLGSCVGIFLFDKVKHAGALGHILLPGRCEEVAPIRPEKYCYNIVEMMIAHLTGEGSLKKNLVGKIAGGARMFHFITASEKHWIGDKNIESARIKLQKEGIPIKAEDVGGNYGRTLIANTETGILRIKTVKHGIKEI
ncbi:MAG: hypothetical protein A2Y62_00670 [Candidatus Fischerbacteria bacterium RBG_13_37_8]|uniref:Probable chemoreceptor glutamine deamidase CheD n=1 Tax=Candidatus Fischerbacteria bacterium RBG_13_37_8 TaxID=1817863 RepID=A0A1F5VNI1_9BACT|nr:MAG: hypothetical protein A2Y62_00670 [Candidatus Fischerbacteria bacterium RBG_13_37_8]